MPAALSVRCPDIECEGCASAIQRSLGAVPGVLDVTVGVQEKQVDVRYDATQVSDTELRERLRRAGFPPT
jgi:Cd2+/Zn2+-exporting ATPase